VIDFDNGIGGLDDKSMFFLVVLLKLFHSAENYRTAIHFRQIPNVDVFASVTD
jgi:hypothetical protein